jgi:hypothetical protein
MSADTHMISNENFYIGHFHMEVFVRGVQVGNIVTTLYRKVGDRRWYYLHTRRGWYDPDNPGGPVRDKQFAEKRAKYEKGDTDQAIFDRWKGYHEDEMPERLSNREKRLEVRCVLAHPVMGNGDDLVAWMLTQDHILIGPQSDEHDADTR